MTELNFEKTNKFIANGFNQECFNAGHGANTSILMFDGTKKMVQYIVVGDLLMGCDSTPVKVLSTQHTTRKMYQIQVDHCEPFTCKLDHILSGLGVNYSYEVTKQYPMMAGANTQSVSCPVMDMLSGEYYMVSKAVSALGDEELEKRYRKVDQMIKKAPRSSASEILYNIETDKPRYTMELFRSLGLPAEPTYGGINMYKVSLSKKEFSCTMAHKDTFFYRKFKVHFLPSGSCYELATNGAYYLGNHIITGGSITLY